MTFDDKLNAVAAYRTAYQSTPGNGDARDQAGFAAIQTEFPTLTIHEQLDLLQYAQGAMDQETPWRAS